MSYPLDNVKELEKSLNSLGKQVKISENSADELNDRLCKSINYLAYAITLHAISKFDYVEDDLTDLVKSLYRLIK